MRHEWLSTIEAGNKMKSFLTRDVEVLSSYFKANQGKPEFFCLLLREK